MDARLAAALMGIQAIKGVEADDGFELARAPRSRVHDEIVATDERIGRASDRPGGVEGGLSIGDPLRMRAAMKPIATVPQALGTVDVTIGEPARAHHQRSDVCAVPAASIIAEAMVALVLADAVAEKFGGDSVPETRRNVRSYLGHLTICWARRPPTVSEFSTVGTTRGRIPRVVGSRWSTAAVHRHADRVEPHACRLTVTTMDRYGTRRER